MEDDTHSNNNDSSGGKTPLEEELSVRDLLLMNSNPNFFTGKTKTQNQLLPKHMLPYSEPIEVSHFSKTKSGETFFDSRNLKRTRDPQLPFDLNEGFAIFFETETGWINILLPCCLCLKAWKGAGRRVCC